MNSAHEFTVHLQDLLRRERVALDVPHPAPPMREVVTPLQTTPNAPASEPVAPAAASDAARAPFQPGEMGVRPAPARPAPLLVDAAPQVKPLTAELNRVHVTLSGRVLEKVAAARDALSHSHPNASFEEILEEGLDLVLERHAKRRGLVERSRAVPPPSGDPEYVPAHVRRAVWKRDGGRCQWALASGGICGSTRQVELDHLVVRARGGAPTVANLRCLCRFHNGVAAREVFGDAWMDQFTRNPRAVADHAASRVPPLV